MKSKEEILAEVALVKNKQKYGNTSETLYGVNLKLSQENKELKEQVEKLQKRNTEMNQELIAYQKWKIFKFLYKYLK